MRKARALRISSRLHLERDGSFSQQAATARATGNELQMFTLPVLASESSVLGKMCDSAASSWDGGGWDAV